MNARKYLFLEVWLLSLGILSSRAALLIHEVGGHALPAWAFGAQKLTIRMSTLGGGSVEWDREFHGWRGMATALGGIVLNLGTGALAWAASRRLRGRGTLSAALFVFGAGSVAGALIYLADGFYYGAGDPVGLAPDSGDIHHVQWLWVLFLPAALLVGWAACRQTLEILPSPVPLERPGQRLRWLLGTVGVAGLAYGGLWWSLHQPEMEGSTRQWRIEREIALETERRAAAPSPLPPPAGATRPAEVPPPRGAPAPVRVEEVLPRVPPPTGPIVLVASFLLGALLGLRCVPSGTAPPEAAPAVSIGLGFVAAGVVVAFRLAA